MRKSKEKATYDLLCQLDVGEPDGKEEKMNQLKFTISLKPLDGTGKYLSRGHDVRTEQNTEVQVL